MCLSRQDDATQREKKLADMIGIGVLFVEHCGVLIPNVEDDKTAITESLRADLRKYTTNKSLEELFAAYRIDATGKLTLPQCVWMLNQFPDSSVLVGEAMLCSETELLSRYRTMITHAQCERLKLDLIEYGPLKGAGVFTTEVMQDGERPFQENILAVMHRSADAHNRAELDSCKFTVGDAVWLSLHTNDTDNAKDDTAFDRIMRAVRVHCKYEYNLQKGGSRKKDYQNKIKDCKTPGQLLRGGTSALEMSTDKYPYHLRPLFPQYEVVEVDGDLAIAKETSERHELTAPKPRPYEAVLALWYEANCKMETPGPFAETSGLADVLFPTRRPWKLEPYRGLAIRRAHAHALKDRFPDNWYMNRDKVPVRVWMHIPMCVSSIFYFKHVHLLLRDTRGSMESSPAPVSDEPDFGFPGLPVILNAKNGGFQNGSNACFLNSAFQALLRSNIGPRFMRSVQRMALLHLNNLRVYWNSQSPKVKQEIKEHTRRILKYDLKFRHGSLPKLRDYHTMILYVIDIHSKNVMEGLDTENIQSVITNNATPSTTQERRALELKADAMIGPNYIHSIPDDGNCFFTAVALALHPDYNTAQLKVRQAELRRDLIAYLRAAMEVGTLNPFIAVDEAWFISMARDQEWGDEYAKMGMSYMLRRRITAYSPENGVLTELRGGDFGFPRDATEIHLFHNATHFDLLVTPVEVNTRCEMDLDNPRTVAVKTLMDPEKIKIKILDDKIRGAWNQFIFFVAMYEMTEVYCAAQSAAVVSMINLYDLLLVRKDGRIAINDGDDIFNYRGANDAGEVVLELCTRSQEFRESINDTGESLDVLLNNVNVTTGTCTNCATSNFTREVPTTVRRIMNIPVALDGVPRNLQELILHVELNMADESMEACNTCDNEGIASVDEIAMVQNNSVNKYRQRRTASEKYTDFACFQLNWIARVDAKGRSVPAHNPNLANLTIPETLQLPGVDSAQHAYNLIAAVHHMRGVHYKACVKTGGVWMDYNDVTAVACTLQDAVRCTGALSDPYLLFYEKATRPSARPGGETPPPRPGGETPPTPRDDTAPGAVYVGLPWDGPPEHWAALQARVPSWAEGSTDEEKTDAMRPWIAANINIALAMIAPSDAAVRVAYMPLVQRLAMVEARRANEIFGTRRIERLRTQRESTVTSGVALAQHEVLTLMSCALFDLFPYSAGKEHEHIGLTRIFRFSSTGTESWGVEKTKCILNYLRMAEADSGGTRVVRFKRHVARFPEAHWLASTRPMKGCTWHDVDAASGAVMKIEEVCDKLNGQAWEVDFANHDIGGGVTGAGCVQEEIRFMQCPELLVSLLFTDRLDDNESIQITGYRQFNDTRGYGREDRPLQPRFEYAGPHEATEPAHGRSMLVMDASYYAEADWKDQFRWKDIKRELNKARCAFDYTENANWPIVTGHWGCGAFHGNHRLKAYIQLLAAAEADKRVEFCNFNDRRGPEVRAFIQSIPAEVPVGKLYKRLKQVVLEHDQGLNWYQDPHNLIRFFERLTIARYNSRVTPRYNVHFDIP